MRGAKAVMCLLSAVAMAACGGDGDDDTGGAGSASRTTTQNTTAPQGAAFYQPPDPLPPQAPGELIWSAPVDAPSDSSAWRVLYHSTAVDGRDIAVSGVVVAPNGSAPAGGRPVVALAHPTTGLADACAPSKQDGLGIPDVVLSPLLDAGYVVTATDYEGLGTPGPHPYGVGVSAARSVLDSVRAARGIPDAHASQRAVLFGHSQGGHAAFFAARVAPQYAPDVDVLGAVGAAPLTNPVDGTRLAAATPGALGFAVAFAKGVEAAYPTLDPALVFTAAGDERSGIVDEQCMDGVLDAFASSAPADVFVQSPADAPEWRSRLESSVLGPGQVAVPMLLVHGSADQILPQPFSDSFVAALCAAGDPIDYRVYPGAGHPDVIPASADDVNRWIGERFTGQAFAPSC